MKAPIDILLFGLDTPHDPEFVIDRPKGFESYVLLCFSTPFFTKTAHGIVYGKPGDCILHDPHFHEYHGTPEGMVDGFRNDWIHFIGEPVAEMVQRYQVPINEIISTGEPHLLGPSLRAIAMELSIRKPYWEQKIALLMEEILLTLGRHKQLHGEFDKFTPAEKAFQDQFVTARLFIQQHFEQDWTVAQMAELVNLSPERFWVLYQKYFRNSPKDDLIIKRIEEAKIRLLNTYLSIEQVAAHCGFHSLYYFSRSFKKRVGCTPSDYRKNMGN